MVAAVAEGSALRTNTNAMSVRQYPATVESRDDLLIHLSPLTGDWTMGPHAPSTVHLLERLDAVQDRGW